jgi:hypothetical protein
MRFLKALVVLAVVGAVLTWFMGAAHIGVQNQDEWYGNMDKGQEEGQEERPPVLMPECATEDQAYGPCYWDGGSNGEGESFWVDEDGNVHYWEDV